MPRRHDPAPHGYDDDGIPKAPHGLNADGTPRKVPRGGPRTGNPGGRPAMTTRPKMTVSGSKTDANRKAGLLALVDAFIVTPLAGLSQNPAIGKKLGRHADALAGDAFILGHFMPGLADAAIVLSKTKPGILSWMDKAEENAPYLMLAQVGVQLVKAVVENHANPNPGLADAGRNLANIRMAQMAEEVNAEAERIARAAAAAAADEPTQPIG